MEEKLREKREKKNYFSINFHTQRIQQQSISSDNDFLKFYKKEDDEQSFSPN